jgi:hypothetical protein
MSKLKGPVLQGTAPKKVQPSYAASLAIPGKGKIAPQANVAPLVIAKPPVTKVRVRPTPRVGGSFDSYTPNNAAIFDAAVTGFISGAYAYNATQQNVSTDYDAVSNQAGLFAVAVDQLIAAGTPDSAHVAFVQQFCQALLANKGAYPLGLTTEQYAPMAMAVAAAYTSVDAVLYPVGGGGGGGSFIYTQDCSAGGTIAYSGPTPVPPLIVLSGSPTAAFNFTWPATAFVTSLLNTTGYAVTTGGVDNPDQWIVAPPDETVTGGTAVMFSCGTGGLFLEAMTPQPYGPSLADGFISAAQNSSAIFVGSLASYNVLHSGDITEVPIYGAAISQLDGDTYGVDAPLDEPIGSGPAEAGGLYTEIFYVAPTSLSSIGNFIMTGQSQGNGGQAVADIYSGSYDNIVPTAYYPGNTWTTQSQGTEVQRSGDRITGTSQEIVHYFPLSDLSAIFACKFRIEMVAKAAVFGSGVMVATDFATAEVLFAASTLAGDVTPATSSVTIYPVSDGSSSNISDMVITVGIVGSNLAVSVTSSANAGPSDETDFQLKVSAEVN